MYIYLGHCINDKLIDDDDMARQRKQIYAQGNALVRKFYRGPICVQKLSEFLCSNRIAPLCTPVRYGAITVLNRCEN